MIQADANESFNISLKELEVTGGPSGLTPSIIISASDGSLI